MHLKRCLRVHFFFLCGLFSCDYLAVCRKLCKFVAETKSITNYEKMRKFVFVLLGVLIPTLTANCSNKKNVEKAVIALYIALGGGTK